MDTKQEVEQLSIPEIILYHLLPGVPILAIAIALSNPVWGMGLSIYLSLMLAILFGLIPVQVGILFFTARKDGRTIKQMISYFEPISIKKILTWAIPCILIAFAVFAVISPREHPLWTCFDWVPNWFRLNLFSISSVQPKQIGVYLTLGFILNGIFGPFIEELYFRGFLLPRMERLGKFAPLVNTILFSLYHFFTPWENITRILAIYPYVYVVWKQKNIKIGIVVHLTLNILGMVGMAYTLL